MRGVPPSSFSRLPPRPARPGAGARPHEIAQDMVRSVNISRY